MRGREEFSVLHACGAKNGMPKERRITPSERQETGIWQGMSGSGK